MGGSAGGYNTLQSIIHDANLKHEEEQGLKKKGQENFGFHFAAAISLCAVADLWDLDKRTHLFEKYYNVTMIGELPEAAEEYWKRSPAYRKDELKKVKIPVLMFQGAIDTVVPREQSMRVKRCLEENGGTVEYVEFADEGHMMGEAETMKVRIAKTAEFLRMNVLYK